MALGIVSQIFDGACILCRPLYQLALEDESTAADQPRKRSIPLTEGLLTCHFWAYSSRMFQKEVE